LIIKAQFLKIRYYSDNKKQSIGNQEWT